MAKKAAQTGKLKDKLPKGFERLVRKPSTGLGELQAVFDEHDVNARGGHSGDQTALMICCENVRMTRWLLDRGADIDAVDEFGTTALHEAVSHGNRAVVLALLEHGASVKRRTVDGDTALHSAVDVRNLDAVKLLLEHGAAVDAKNCDELTPLELALEDRDTADLVDIAFIAQALLEAGANKSRLARELTETLAHTFRLHKARLGPDRVEQADAAIKRLCRLLGIEPPPLRKPHDGHSMITVKSKGWQKQHTELWDLLVPDWGPARTIQGEVIRISGRIADEIYRNGGINWDRGYAVMGKDLLAYLASQNAVSRATAADCRRMLTGPPSDTEATRLSKLAVAWVLANPVPSPFGKIRHRR